MTGEELQAGRATLAALAAVQRSLPTRSEVLVLPGLSRLTFEEASMRLAEVAKPTLAVGFVLYECLAIAAWPNAREMSDDLSRGLRHRDEVFVRGLESLARGAEYSAVLASREFGDLEMSRQGVEQWLRDYTLLGVDLSAAVMDPHGLAPRVQVRVEALPARLVHVSPELWTRFE